MLADGSSELKIKINQRILSFSLNYYQEGEITDLHIP